MFTLIDLTLNTPKKGTAESAGTDLQASSLDKIYTLIDDVTGARIRQGRYVVGLGVKATIPYGYFGMLALRSGAAVRLGASPVNGVGVIDSDYDGELRLVFKASDVSFIELEKMVKNKERIAQLIVIPYINTSEEMSETRTGGFGSTGK